MVDEHQLTMTHLLMLLLMLTTTIVARAFVVDDDNDDIENITIELVIPLCTQLMVLVVGPRCITYFIFRILISEELLCDMSDK
jgi:uncharacterized protein involved in response to NO